MHASAQADVQEPGIALERRGLFWSADSGRISCRPRRQTTADTCQRRLCLAGGRAVFTSLADRIAAESDLRARWRLTGRESGVSRSCHESCSRTPSSDRFGCHRRESAAALWDECNTASGVNYSSASLCRAEASGQSATRAAAARPYRRTLGTWRPTPRTPTREQSAALQ